jgi:hypothetical protein
MGFRLMENFRAPYFSRSIREFWQRWHISLSSWFKDYLYIPLGGNRCSALRRSVNLMIVFLVSGLWHGASWTFVVWGMLHGLFLIAEDTTRPLRDCVFAVMGFTRESRLVKWLSMASTFTLVTAAWVFFRARTMAEAAYVLTHMPQGLLGDLAAVLRGEAVDGVGPRLLLFNAGLIVAALVVEYAVARIPGRREAEWISRAPVMVRYATYMLLVYGPLVLGSSAMQQQFIYFQF